MDARRGGRDQLALRSTTLPSKSKATSNVSRLQNGIAEHRNDDFAGDLPTLGARSESTIKIRSRQRVKSV
jgi:hypothetical protein